MCVSGKDLNIRDCIEVWWSKHQDLIISLEPYRGPLEYLWPTGAQIAEFATGVKMTIGNDEEFKRIV